MTVEGTAQAPILPSASQADLAEALPTSATSAAPLNREHAAQLFAIHGDYVWNSLRRIGVRNEDLEDLTHDTFVAVFRHWSSYDVARPLKPWLFGFALRIASDHRRRAHHRFEVSDTGLEPRDDAPDAIGVLLQKEREALARSALSSIELSRRAVFILHELDGVTIPEVAAGLQIPVATAYSRLRLSREDFAAAVKRLSLRAR